MSLGQDDMARKDLEEALKLSPKDSVIIKALGHLNQEEKSKARAQQVVFGGLF